MLVNVNADELRVYLADNDDAFDLGGGEYTLDLYDAQPPVTLDLAIEGSQVDVLAALELLYDPESDGWYPGERIRDADLLARLLDEAIKGA